MWPRRTKVEQPKEPQHCPRCGVLMGVPPEMDGEVLCGPCYYSAGEPLPTELLGATTNARRIDQVEKRLALGDEMWRAREAEALTAMGECAVPTLAHILHSSQAWQATSAAALALGRIGGNTALDELMPRLTKALNKERYRRFGRPFMRLMAVLMVLEFLSRLVNATLLHLPGAPALDQKLLFDGIKALFFVPIWVIDIHLGERRSLAQALAALSDPRAVGVLARAYANRQMKDTVATVLRLMLPKVTEDVAAGFTAPERAAILQLLGSSDYEMVRGALVAIAAFGADDAVEPIKDVLLRMARHTGILLAREGYSVDEAVQRLLGSPTTTDTDELRELQWVVPLASVGAESERRSDRTTTVDEWEELLALARQTLATVEARAARNKDRQSLLRHAGAPADDAATLLRPAGGQNEAEPEQLLLRRADDDPN